MSDSDESTEKILLKGSMRWIREERNKYWEMYERTRHDLKEEKRNRKAVQLHYRCYFLSHSMPTSIFCTDVVGCV